jgi:hypothetical protein
MNAVTTHLDIERPGDRVRRHTAAAPNERIEAYTRWRIEDTIRGGRDAIVARLTELEKEWDVDRALMLNFAVVGGAGFFLGAFRRAFKKSLNGWQVFTTTQLGFLALHAVVGWCPPAALFRRLGFRTSREIEAERRALRQALER